MEMIKVLFEKRNEFCELKEDCVKVFSTKMCLLTELIHTNKKLEEKLNDILSETKFNFVHLDQDIISFNGRYNYMLVISSGEIKVIRYSNYRYFVEVSLVEAIKYATFDNLIHISTLLDSAIQKAKDGELQYYL